MYTTFQSTAVAMKLYTVGNELEKCFEEALCMLVATASARVMLLCLFQSGVPVRKKYEKHESCMYSDIHESDTRSMRAELLVSSIRKFRSPRRSSFAGPFLFQGPC